MWISQPSRPMPVKNGSPASDNESGASIGSVPLSRNSAQNEEEPVCANWLLSIYSFLSVLIAMRYPWLGTDNSPAYDDCFVRAQAVSRPSASALGVPALVSGLPFILSLTSGRYPARRCGRFSFPPPLFECFYSRCSDRLPSCPFLHLPDTRYTVSYALVVPDFRRRVCFHGQRYGGRTRFKERCRYL